MATKKRKHRSGIMGCSGIPYAQRLKMQHQADIVDCRDHAARIAMYCTSMALHDVAGIGYQRLARFAVHHKELVEEFYQDQDVGMSHCVTRMKELGMPIDGEFYQPPDDGGSRRELDLQTHALQAVQVALILGAIAANDVFGFGPERQKRLCDRIKEISTRYKHQGQGFLLEEMAKLGFAIVDGKAMVFLDEDGNAVKPQKVEVAK
jgi:hypothetical protein